MLYLYSNNKQYKTSEVQFDWFASQTIGPPLCNVYPSGHSFCNMQFCSW